MVPTDHRDPVDVSFWTCAVMFPAAIHLDELLFATMFGLWAVHLYFLGEHSNQFAQSNSHG